MTRHYFSYLALGDSYTIGESVPLHEGFPYQVVQILRKKGLHFHAPEVVAKTGWTSFELADHILHTQLNEQYDFVSLLIGVNNQYRGLPVADFREEFDYLLKKAIHFAGNKPERVIVLSIPDWGITPFAAGKDSKAISEAIDNFNQVCEEGTKKLGGHFINITAQTRMAKDDSSLLASDQLHYSAKSHAVWAEQVVKIIEKTI
ncbi:SGNH/GDSL hydrolase family protein [Sediminibacterium goheungense]|uniref:Lysophospholipase L1-like esterase n=1 Tax=Sediminibacterium goheungense TaxID=1086393 RepID=A0A4R6IZZ4_9BACT|nr:SGNH/GDSL hydrolase family protein [Sediminibacterium goheungense]TDO28041.1 lysophospholipase L1-like esterase [Sediminibacterium goheungense]